MENYYSEGKYDGTERKTDLLYYSKSSISKRSNVWQKNIGLKI